MQIIDVGGIKLNTLVQGEGSAITLLHGLAVGSIATWYYGAKYVLAKTNKVILYDLRGHGKSQMTRAGYDIDSMVEDLKNILDYYDIENTHLGGHSYGGLIALHFALKYPARVKKLALIDIPLPASKFVTKISLSDGNEKLVHLSDPLLRSALDEGNRHIKKFVDVVKFICFDSDIAQELCRDEDVPDSLLRSLACPTLCVYGMWSDFICVGLRLNQLIPNVKFTVLPCGHFLPLEAHAETMDLMGEFFDG